MPTSSVAVTEGSGKNLATHSLTEDAVTKEISRVVPNTPAGVDQTFGAGAVASGTPRVTHASDDPVTTAVQLIDDAIVADDAAFTPATTKVMMAGFQFDDTATDSIDEGDAGAARMSANRNQLIQIRDAAGNERGVNVNASNQLAVAGPVTNAGTFAVQTASALLDVTLSLDTSAYATGDVLADTQAVTSAFRVADGTGLLQSVMVLDEDDQGIEMDLIFLSANNSIGTENAAVSVSDANARDILGRVNIASTDYVDLGGCRIATKLAVGLMLKAASGTTTLYVAAIARGAPTHTASGVRLRLGILQD